MSNTQTTPFPQTESVFIPTSCFTLFHLKDFINTLMGKIQASARGKNARYQPADFILVKLYALAAHMSTHQAAETLNAQLKKVTQTPSSPVVPKKYVDGKRERRLVPHQTDIDKYLARFKEKEIKTIFGGMLDYLNGEIFQRVANHRSWTAIVDNTKYPYYGTPDPLKHIGCEGLPGTKVAWMFQALSIHSRQIHLFTDFNSLTKGVYRAEKVPEGIRWLQWQGLDVRGILFDREFYRAALVSALRKENVRSLFPTKKYPWVKTQMRAFLNGTGKMIIGNIFAQSTQQYPYQQATFVRLVLIGKNGQTAYDVRQKFWKGHLTLKQAMHELHGFFTNYRPWRNTRAWERFLTRTYKRRWNIETGFAMLNAVSPASRARTHPVKLANMYLRGFLSNWWQAWRLTLMRQHVFARDSTFQVFRTEAQNAIFDMFLI